MITSFDQFESALKALTVHLDKSLAEIHIGRATPAILDHVMVEAYDGRMAISALASIQVQPPFGLIIEPWDQNILKKIERALQIANLGAQPVVDKNLIRLTFQPPTAEKRALLAKQAEALLEQTKISAKGPREDYLKYLKQAEKAGDLSEDQSRDAQDKLQKLLTDTTKKWQEAVQKKMSDLQTM